LDLRRGYEEPLFSLIGEYLKRWQLAYNQPVHFKAEGRDTDLSPSVAYEVRAILEETLENVHRHSQANEVWVEVQISDKDGLQLEVRDNGIGLNDEMLENLKAMGYPGPLHGMQPRVDPVGNYHFGLIGMIERVSWLNGQLELIPDPEEGLRVKVCIPL
jgi:signal transduction histidine kinase